MHINLGSKQELNAGTLIALINKNSPGQRVVIGKIEILRNFSFFEIDSNRVKFLMKEFQGAMFNGTPIEIGISKANQQPVAVRPEKHQGFQPKGERSGKRKKIRRW